MIANVTGPDEYAAMVDNDFYANAMARENLRRAAWAVRRLQSADPEAGSRLAGQTGRPGALRYLGEARLPHVVSISAVSGGSILLVAG